MRKYVLQLFVIICSLNSVLSAQIILPNTLQDLERRFASLDDGSYVPFFWSPFGLGQMGLNTVIGNIDWYSSYNSSIPNGLSDGSLWQGKGYNTRLSGGIGFHSSYFDFFFCPEFGFTQNQAFDLNPYSTNKPYGDAHGSVWDHPDRFGDQSLSYFSLGQSRLSLFWNSLRLSIGTENRIWGASRYNSILLSAQGSGFPHLELALDPSNSILGRFEFSILYGYLEPSSYRYVNSYDGRRLWSGLFVAYSPWFYENLTLAAARTIQSYWQTLEMYDFLMPVIPGLNFGVDKYDQRMSLSFRLREPSIGLELYGEWSRNDFSPSVTAWLLNLEHSQNWVLGFQKKNSLGGSFSIVIEGEIAVLSLGIENFINENGYSPLGADLYTHWMITEGYTVQGQDLGAACGNGNMQSVGIFVMNNFFFVGYELHRWVKDYSLLIYNPLAGEEHCINVAFLHDIRCGFKLNNHWSLTGRLGYVGDLNRYFERNDVHSLSASVNISYSF